MAARRVLYPFFQFLCYGFLTIALFSALYVTAVSQLGGAMSAPQKIAYQWSMAALSNGLSLIAVAMGFIGLVFLSFREKFAVLAMMLSIAWLIR